MYNQKEYSSRYQTSISNIIQFYKEQIRRFEKIGLGNQTEFRTIITERLLAATRRRLSELQEQKVNGWIKKRGLNGFE
jgi:hypothetical protein